MLESKKSTVILQSALQANGGSRITVKINLYENKSKLHKNERCVKRLYSINSSSNLMGVIDTESYKTIRIEGKD
jgi:ribosomal protein S24E